MKEMQEFYTIFISIQYSISFLIYQQHSLMDLGRYSVVASQIYLDLLEKCVPLMFQHYLNILLHLSISGCFVVLV